MNLAGDSVGIDNQELLFAGFNQDAGCFACGTTKGFVIYNVDPFRETFQRIFSNGGIGIVEMLFRCNLVALVGGGRNPRYPPNKVMIWDDHQNKCIGELKFRTEVKAVKLRRDSIVVVLETKVFVYRFRDLKLLDQIVTIANPKGLVSLCPEANSNVLAVPGLQKGSIRIELYNMSKATLIKAHDADLAQFALNIDGSRIASASEKGTLIRIWNCHTGEPLRELRRGVDRADIYCICFNGNSSLLACSSDKGTIHVFSLESIPIRRSQQQQQQQQQASSDHHEEIEQQQPSNNNNNNNNRKDSTTTTSSSFSTSTTTNNLPGNTTNPLVPSTTTTATDPSLNNNNNNPNTTATNNNNTNNNSNNNKSMAGLLPVSFFKGFLPANLVPKYFESEWSFAQVRGIEGKAICAFSKDSNRLHIIGSDRSFIVAKVQEGECERIITDKILKSAYEHIYYNNHHHNYNQHQHQHHHDDK
jgi:WD repeat-containing protein 45